jgi:hypothetical protein
MDLAKRHPIFSGPDYGFSRITVSFDIGIRDRVLLGAIRYCHHVSYVRWRAIPKLSSRILQ